MAPSSSRPHIVLFPFMAKGHTIPLLHLARLLLLHFNTTITIFTTPANRPFIHDSLSDTEASIIELPFPQNINGLATGVECTEKLPSMSHFLPFAASTKLMQPNFEQALQALLNVTCIISDGFLGWTQQSASKFGIPRLVFYGMNNYSQTLLRIVTGNGQLSGPELDDEEFAVTNFPWIKLTRNDFDEPFNSREPKGPYMDFLTEQFIASSESYGIVINSFYELEPLYVEHWNHEFEPKAWCIGPFCSVESAKNKPQSYQKPSWLQWLDQKLAQGSSVLYVAFGSQADIPSKQMREIAVGLENSKVNFLWVMRKSESELDVEFKERVKERGLVVGDWVDQRAILGHRCVQGFLSHCGWNSVLESICAKVPVLAWPMLAEQHLNARMLVEEIKVGLRVQTSNGSVRGFVKSESLEKMVKELMEGEIGKEARKKVKEYGEVGKKAIEKGGSSWHTLNQLIDELQALRNDC